MTRHNSTWFKELIGSAALDFGGLSCWAGDKFVRRWGVLPDIVATRCPECGTLNPQAVIDGTGDDAIRCVE